jgi:hypothetical protein
VFSPVRVTEAEYLQGVDIQQLIDEQGIRPTRAS